MHAVLGQILEHLHVLDAHGHAALVVVHRRELLVEARRDVEDGQVVRFVPGCSTALSAWAGASGVEAVDDGVVKERADLTGHGEEGDGHGNHRGSVAPAMDGGKTENGLFACAD